MPKNRLIAENIGTILASFCKPKSTHQKREDSNPLWFSSLEEPLGFYCFFILNLLWEKRLNGSLKRKVSFSLALCEETNFRLFC